MISISRQTLGDLLRRTRQRYPKKVAIRCGTTEWTYEEFDDTATRIACGLAALGVATGDRVAVLARNSHAFAALRFGVARLGAVLVPINFMLNATEAKFILEHSGAMMICADSGLAALAAQAAAGTAVRQLVWLPGEDESAPAPGFVPFDTPCWQWRAFARSGSPWRHARADRLHKRHRISPEGRDAQP